MQITNLDITPVMNKVLIEVELSKYINLENGRIAIDTSFEIGKSAPVTGKVIKPPKELLFSLDYPIWKKFGEYMEWETEIEIKEGDIAYFSYFAAIRALGRKINRLHDRGEDNSRFFILDNKIYMFIDYWDLFLVKRGDDVIMTNGYVLVEPVEKEYTNRFALPDSKDKNETNIGRIAYIGSCNKRYENPKYVDTENIEVGDMVLFYNWNNTLLENDCFKSFPKLFKMQRRYIMAKIML